MAGSDSNEKPKPKSKWDKLDIILRPVGGLLTALSVALVGFLGSRALESGRAADSKVQLYAELMSSRETSDSELRQGMFNTIVSRFLNPEMEPRPAGDDPVRAMEADYEIDVLRLEMLAYNFHDSLDLAPLFKDVHRRLADGDLAENKGIPLEHRQVLLKRLEKVANEVIDKQISALDEETNVARTSFSLEHFEQEGGFLPKLISTKLSYQDGLDTKYKAFSVDVISIDRANKEVEVRLTVWDASDVDSNPKPVADVTFNLGFFDFPLVDNTRIGRGERCALVLNGFGEYEAQLSLVFFPGSRASLKEKQFYDDIVEELRRSPALAAAYK